MTILEKANQILADKEANLLPENLRQGITCLGVDGTLIELVGEEKSVIATTEEQEITPTEGHNGITKIIVRPVTNAIDASIKAENIKKGTTILGVEGSYKGEILIWPAVENLPAIANVEDLGIVVTPEHYENSNYETEFGTRVYLPDQVTFETNPGELTGYIGIAPEDETIIDSVTGSLTATLYTFNISLNSGVDTLEVIYSSEDGLIYTKSSVTGTGIFQYNTNTKILTSTVNVFPYTDEALLDTYNTVGGLFLQKVVDPTFAGVYEFTDTGWVRIDVDTSDAVATADDIAFGKTAYVKGERIEGAVHEYTEGMENDILVPSELEEYEDVNNGTCIRGYWTEFENKLIRPGYTEYVKIRYSKLAEFIGLTADKIKAGETILGITGTYAGQDDIVSGN